jgi:hypothetical protein
MANRPALLLVALSRQIEKDGIAAFIRAPPPHLRAARRQISNDRESGEGRSARLKCRTLRRDKNKTEMAEMLDGS